MTLSVCLIVKDEEQTLARCLSCVKKIADEIVVVDTGSVDGTTALARQFTPHVYSFKWEDDFSAARNYSLDKATCDYVMWLDADDIITDENCALIRKLVDGGGFDLAFLLYATAFDGPVPTYYYYRERIFRRDKKYRFCGAVHEVVTPCGKTVYSTARIDHKKVKPTEPMRNLKIYQNRIARGISLNEREKFYYGRELFFNGMYRESIAVLRDFLSGGGWKENKIEACFNLYDCYTALGETSEAEKALLSTLLYSAPRARFCCIMGERFFLSGDLKSSIFWYMRALACKTEFYGGGFFNPDYVEFIPCMQLCVLYDRLGDLKTANAFNERAGKIKPQNASYLHNVKYFKQKLSNEV